MTKFYTFQHLCFFFQNKRNIYLYVVTNYTPSPSFERRKFLTSTASETPWQHNQHAPIAYLFLNWDIVAVALSIFSFNAIVPIQPLRVRPHAVRAAIWILKRINAGYMYIKLVCWMISWGIHVICWCVAKFRAVWTRATRNSFIGMAAICWLGRDDLFSTTKENHDIIDDYPLIACTETYSHLSYRKQFFDVAMILLLLTEFQSCIDWLSSQVLSSWSQLPRVLTMKITLFIRS
jgi:hypothetical protein